MKKFTSLLLLCLIATNLFAQQRNIQAMLNQITPLSPKGEATSPPPSPIGEGFNTSGYNPHVAQWFDFEKGVKAFNPALSQHSTKKLTSYPDTLIVGAAPYDTVTITGTLTHNGPIWVALKGVLIIKHANLTNLGDLVVFNNGKVIIDSSTVSFPQAYFYQRSLIVVNKGNVNISNSTLAYGGFSHNCSVQDTGTLMLTNVTQPDWMTTGMGSHATININHTNQVGEIIIEDYVNLNIKNATNCLLWHQIPDTAVINWSFGKHDTAYGYMFNNSQPGLNGIEYNVHADSVYKVMWALMPTSASTINITNSKIRSIGLWFNKPKDSVMVSGITDNATYSGSFTTPLSDRTLTFNNCTVQTWSFYVFHKSVINVTGCIAGEIGTENGSKMYGNNYLVDGSGGYHWTSDTSYISAGNATVTSYVRSEKYGFFVFAYGTVGGAGAAEAIDNALLIVVQSSVPADPTAVAGGCAWFDNINQTGNLFADSIAPIDGSAWIHRGPTSNWMHFKSWQLFYQSVDSTTWIPVTGIDTVPVGNGLLANWNTHSLASGSYNLDLRVTDSWGNKVDAIRNVTLLPLILGIQSISASTSVDIYPNPSNGLFKLEIKNYELGMNNTIDVYNVLGEKVCTQFVIRNSKFVIDLSGQPSGVYFYKITTANGETMTGKLVVDKK